MRMPPWALPEMTLPAPAVVPPTVFAGGVAEVHAVAAVAGRGGARRVRADVIPLEHVTAVGRRQDPVAAEAIDHQAAAR